MCGVYHPNDIEQGFCMFSNPKIRFNRMNAFATIHAKISDISIEIDYLIGS
jgi:hypothetical protein